MITVFGSINMDLIATPERLPKPGETVMGSSFTTAAGGKGANQALAARRAGSIVRMAGAVGDDRLGSQALALLADAAVDLNGVRSAAEATGTAHILVDDEGENVIVVVPGANGTVAEEDARRTVGGMSRGDYLMLQFEIPNAAIEAALVAAKQKGVTSIVNIAPFSADARRLGAMADVLVANETEFDLFVGKGELSDEARETTMRALHAASGQTIIVTLGADGVIAIRKNEIFRAAGLVIEPVDTVGAGDTFCGYLAASLDAGLGFKDALRRAAVAGSLACLKPGAQPSIPFAAAVDAEV
ncbi:ribokinase [Shinella zoogloeoides]|jgi:ribokinase|uniref:ribokinase n=1 Tax=Shinella zoogloeoides TaxID=352475 RepID=UPI00273EB36A|nr:ribokinase [Shinella zoogloeoides]WLR92843.1 ribokinase [Shinella zoogloeoides]